jgi:hypothetical protein
VLHAEVYTSLRKWKLQEAHVRLETYKSEALREELSETEARIKRLRDRCHIDVPSVNTFD